jgi:VIT1/CCC1 family predicted Fe2+/Mn2+ transporter
VTIEQEPVQQWCESPLVIMGVSAALAVVIGVLPLLWGHSPTLAAGLAALLVLALAITVKLAPNRR